ncbi:transposase domain-containing protein [Paraliobacillus sp. JSM ZJ581]|uniref:transposase domain-containing protein n=1 Tax=Paraliobacillus sp. JSM ZJ581 TaxID=3342118 RepID=UPI0035A99A2C
MVSSFAKTGKNNLNPYAYLKYLFEELPNGDLTNPNEIPKYLSWSDALPEACRVPSKK